MYKPILVLVLRIHTHQRHICLGGLGGIGGRVLRVNVTVLHDEHTPHYTYKYTPQHTTTRHMYTPHVSHTPHVP
jgi:hypothetical protein